MKKDSKSLSIAKITRPNMQHITQRQRLFSILDKKAVRPVIWIAAPAGSGKTTLVSSYIESRKLPCIWYQINAGDSDLATFFYYMSKAIRKSDTCKKKPMPLLNNEYLSGISVFTRRYFEELFDRLNSLRSSNRLNRSAIVFDNYQEVSEDSRFNEMFANALDVVPEGVRVIIISRKEPPQQFARLQANSKKSIVGWEEIKFTIKETEELIRVTKLPGNKYQKTAVKDYRTNHHNTALLLYKKTGGWAAGLKLMLSSPIEHKPSVHQYFQVNEVFNYFANEIFKKADLKTQKFLLKTEFLPSMTAQMAEKLTDMKGAESILSGLSHNNYFTDLRQGPEPFYQYHSLFRNFLIDMAKETFSISELSELRLKTAVLLEQSGYIDDAITLFSESGDTESCIRLILAHAPLMVQQGRSNTVHKWISYVPEGILQKEPWLYYWEGVVRMPFNTTESIYCFKEAFELFAKAGDNTGSYLSSAGMINAVFLERGDFSRMDKYIAWIVKESGDNLKFPSPEVELQVIISMLYAFIFRSLGHQNIRKWLSKAYEMLESNIGKDDKVTLAANLHHY